MVAGLYPSVLLLMGLQRQLCDGTVIYSSVGASVALPCGTNAHRSCSAVLWRFREMFMFDDDLVQDGKVTDIKTNRARRLRVGPDCSLLISNLTSEDGGQYTCQDGAISPSTSLQLLNITVTPNTGLIARTTVSLNCYLSVATGLVFCNHTGISFRWVSENGAELWGNRYKISHLSACHSTMAVELTRTDHNKHWRCQLIEGKEVKTTQSYVTKLIDGVEEVFASVGGSVTLPCTDIATPGAGEIFQWSVGEKTLITQIQEDHVTSSDENDATTLADRKIQGFIMKPDSSLLIKSVTPAHSGYYQCSQLNGSGLIFTHRRILFHTLEVPNSLSVNRDHAGVPPQQNFSFTLTCSLTCADACDKNMNLTWSHSAGGHQGASSVVQVNNTLMSQLFVPELRVSERLACIVLREGAEKARQEWAVQADYALPVIVSCVLLLILLLCVAVMGTCWKRKHKTHTESAYANFRVEKNMALYEECGEPACRTDPEKRNLEGEQSEAISTVYVLQSAVNQE
ncbi:uncharacterized protein LOC118231215 isoform X1 [Anguilla anguilla]|uniref:uncharacterized protein LOC118231215 isoform X1 n=1 Tax=Anguilla anguilla TaxID=7936 RepID=UPI0015AAC5C9|nr:uncharacterized protein LOC118231215 isoform X1 [Anguilla anguilla]